MFNVLSSHISTTDLIHTLAQPIALWLYTHPGMLVSQEHLRVLHTFTPIIFQLVRCHNNTWSLRAASLLKALSKTCSRPFEDCVAPVPHIKELPDLNYTQTGHW